MHRFWDSFLRPVCDAVQPKELVEVGSSGGFNTRSILEYCRETGSRCHIIDPFPPGNLADIQGLLDEVGTFHQTTSHEALPRLPADLFFVDGDHNWYTVYHELKAIEGAAREAGRKLPVITLHDVAWPYGRRDLYYGPDRIPTEYRHPFARRGIAWGKKELCNEGGYNWRHDNAIQEGGPKNGVLTGIEDFVSESEAGWKLLTLPTFHGLALLFAPGDVPAETAAKLDALFEIPAHIRQHMLEVEEYRVHLMTELVDVYRRLGGKPGRRVAQLVRGLKKIAGTGE